jgi:hypothetical protein
MTELLDPTPDLPDDTPIDGIRFPTRIRNVLAAERLKTVGETKWAASVPALRSVRKSWRLRSAGLS